MRTHSQQKAALTRAVETGSYEKVRAEVKRAIDEWDSPEWLRTYSTNAWPDNWSLWQRALDDAAASKRCVFGERMAAL